jgi:arsenate reductase
MSADKLTIYHNPGCSKSRETLQLLLQNDKIPEIIEYLQTPPNREELIQIIKMLGIAPRDLLRTTEQAYIDAKLDDSVTNDLIIDAICKFPILLQRPIVISGKRAIIGRPPSLVLEII